MGIKKNLCLLSLCLTTSVSFSQQLVFCERVDSNNGSPYNPSTTFSMSRNGGYLDMLVTLQRPVNSDYVTFDLFKINEDSHEVFENTIRHQVEPDFTWFSNKTSFFKEGIYHVYVYDDKDQLLCAGKVSVKTQ